MVVLRIDENVRVVEVSSVMVMMFVLRLVGKVRGAKETNPEKMSEVDSVVSGLMLR